MHKNSIKGNRINSEVAHELSDIVRHMKDPRISPMTSIMRAEVTADLKFCKVYVSVLGTDDERRSTMKTLKSAAGFIRNQLARTVNLRNTPELIFTEDDSIEYGVRMSKLIDDVIAEDRRREDEAEETSGTEDDGDASEEPDGEKD